LPVKNKKLHIRVKTDQNKNRKAIDPLDPLFWSQEWEKTVKTSSLSRKNTSPDRWTEYWSHISKSYGTRIQCESKIVDEIVRILLFEKMLTKESEVLDIGCGPGTFAMPFARFVNHVLALDPAIKMIDTLREEAQRQGLSNISLLCQRWEDSLFLKEFDFAFASFSPAICNAESLLKMHQASRKHCCLITSSNAENFRVRNELWERILGEPFHSSTFHIVYPFNYLYASGFRPQIRFLKNEVCYEEPVDVVIDRYEHYFRMFIGLNASTQRIIRQYFEDLADEGIVKTHEEKAFAIMWWAVEK